MDFRGRAGSQLSKGDISPHKQSTTPFPSCGSLLMRIRDDWCRMTKASPCPMAYSDCLGSGLIGSLEAGGSSANSCCDFGWTLASSGFCAWRRTGDSQTTRSDPNRHRSGSRTFSYLPHGWPVAPGRRPEHPPSAAWQRRRNNWRFFSNFEADRRSVRHFYWPTIFPRKLLRKILKELLQDTGR